MKIKKVTILKFDEFCSVFFEVFETLRNKTVKLYIYTQHQGRNHTKRILRSEIVTTPDHASDGLKTYSCCSVEK